MSSASAPPRLPALDALRAGGAAAVVAVHVGFATGFTGSSSWGAMVARLDVGVAIFFVLSGFLLFRPFAYAMAHGARRPSAGRYLWRRALRILPAYWLTVAVCLLVLPGNAGVPWSEWVRYATFTQFYGRGHLHDALGHTWSLTVEAAFYLLLPVLAVLAVGRSWRPRRTIAVLCAGGALITGGWLAAMAAGGLDMGLHTTWFPAFAAWFGGGMVLATMHVAAEAGRSSRLTAEAGRSSRQTAEAGRPFWLIEVARAPLTCWALAAGLFVIAATPLTGPRGLDEPTPGQFATRMVLFLAISVMVVLPVAFAGPGPVGAALTTPLARWLGLVSYGLFLWHPFVLVLLRPVMGAPTFAGLIRTYVLTMAGALALATLSWYGLEQPVQMLGRRRAPAQFSAAAEDSTDAGPVEVLPVISSGATPAEAPSDVSDGAAVESAEARPRPGGSVPSQSAANAASPAS
ncbi:acyltransferase family protein [Actinoplanes sp. KI2]|uniref:acyltransferase family protein n=1 Tax=Actinoplanes sp. KI2 TaxID=2983315 RepID=UPI00398391EB